MELSQRTAAESAVQVESFMRKAFHKLPCRAALSALAEGEEAFGQGHPDLVCNQNMLHLTTGRKGWKWVPQPLKDRQLSSFLWLVVARSQGLALQTTQPCLTSVVQHSWARRRCCIQERAAESQHAPCLLPPSLTVVSGSQCLTLS